MKLYCAISLTNFNEEFIDILRLMVPSFKAAQISCNSIEYCKIISEGKTTDERKEEDEPDEEESG